jgi:hypothetical protein
MRQVSAGQARAILEGHQAAGLHVDERVVQQLDAPGELYVVCLPDMDTFLALIWQSIDDARPLVPVKQPRTLRDCADRLGAFGWRFEKLVEDGFPWFAKCVEIDSAYDHSKFGWMALTPSTPEEQQESPLGSSYIYDGVHKSIVLAKKLITGELEYRPLEALLLTPRRA